MNAPHEHCGHHHHRGAHPAGEPHRHEEAPNPWARRHGVLTLLGGLTIAGLLIAAALSSPDGSTAIFARTFLTLVLQSAPALLMGFALAGVVPFLLTPARAGSLSGGGPLGQSLRGVVFGLPLPVCSCGVLPLYASLVRSGAPVVAALAFFVATPELGLDAVLLSIPLLGGELTAARVVAAFLVAVLVALLVGRSLRAANGRHPITVNRPRSVLSLTAKLQEGFRFGFIEVFDHTMPWVLLGLGLAAAAEPLLSHGAIAAIPRVLQVPLAALVGVPVYVCASGATPLAALALHKGLSAGAALAFLIAGPATNVTTFGVLARLHGRRTALRFGLAVTLLAVCAGWAVDALGFEGAPVLDAAGGAAHAGDAPLAWLSAGVLAVLTALSLRRQGPRAALRQILEPIHHH